jgi:hypothetical protein
MPLKFEDEKLSFKKITPRDCVLTCSPNKAYWALKWHDQSAGMYQPGHEKPLGHWPNLRYNKV